MDLSQLQPTDEKCFLGYLPFYHTIGLNAIFDHIFLGIKCVVLSGYTFAKFLHSIQEFKVKKFK